MNTTLGCILLMSDKCDSRSALLQIASEHANEITLNGNRGNFLAAVSLSNVVYGRLSKSFREHWTQLSGQLASALKPKLYNFELPARLALAVGYKDVIADFSNAGMISFLERLDNYTGGHFNMVILTDTGKSSLFIYRFRSVYSVNKTI